MDMDDSDILNFGHTQMTTFKAALRARGQGRGAKSSRPPLNSASDELSSGCSDEEGRQRKKKNLGGREGSLASRLIHSRFMEPCPISSDSDDDDDSILGPGDRKKVKKAPSPARSESSSRSPSPEPSPVLPGSSFDTPTDRTSKRVLDKASNALNQLIYSTYSTPGSDYCSELNESLVSSASKQDITIRVRFRGKIRKYTINKGDPLSLVCSLLASELKECDSSKFLLSHKTTTLSETDSPLSLGLTTADIIDAIQLSESFSVSAGGGSPSLSTSGDNIKIKIQTSKKSINYSISKTDPLKKAMDAFAKELAVPARNLTFSFDGDPISPTQTAEDLDMEDGDCIDARPKS